MHLSKGSIIAIVIASVIIIAIVVTAVVLSTMEKYEVGQLSLYYVEKQLTPAGAVQYASSVGGVIALEDCINGMVKYETDKSKIITENTPQQLIYDTGSFLADGYLSNGNLIPTGSHNYNGTNAILNGVFIYGPLINEGIPIHYDSNGQYKKNCHYTN